jgi:two-component system, LytTR family, response regulator
MSFRAVIIDDEPHARVRLRKLLDQQHPDVDVEAEAGSGSEAVQTIDSLEPDLVFLDIEMPDFDGFEVLRRVHARPAVIFTTGYDQYAVQAFEAAGIDYLLKPIEPDQLSRAMDRLARLRPRTAGDDDFERRVEAVLRAWKVTPQPRSWTERVAVRLGERILLIDVKDITHFHAKEKYVFLVTVAGKEHIVNNTIAELEEQLDPSLFVRVHRSTIVNVRHIREIQIWFGGKYRLLLGDKEASRVVVSKNMAKRLKTVIPF